MKKKEKCPWKDYAGNELYEGDVIAHPDGSTGKILFLPEFHEEIHDQWRVDYGDEVLRLSLQIGDKGQAVKA